MPDDNEVVAHGLTFQDLKELEVEMLMLAPRPSAILCPCPSCIEARAINFNAAKEIK